MPIVKRPIEEHQLTRPFDGEVALQKGQMIAEYEVKIAELAMAEKKLKSEARDIKDQMDELQLQAVARARELRSGKHLVPVECRWEMSKDSWILYATDTGETLRTEPTTVQDRQGELKLA